MGFKDYTIFGGFKGYKNLLGGKKGGGGSFDYQPYSGLRPPRVDYSRADGTKVEYLRPTQDLLQKTVMDRSQGVGVGYDPAWMKLNTDLINSNANKTREDSLRDATGRLSSSGLSGNARAMEALAGRVNRDSDRSISDSMTALSISDLERKNQERDVNTGRLQSLNSQNFGQENTAANFDLGVYNAEQGNRAKAYGMNTEVDQYNQGQSDEFTNSLLQAGAGAAGMYFGGPAGAAVGQQSMSALTSGKGLNTNSFGAVDPNMSSAGPGYRNSAYKKLVR